MSGTRSARPSLDKRSAADEAYDRILDLILTRGLRPSERTSVNLLANQLQLGRTPIKEAITRLETEGVLTVVGRSGTMVNSISATQARQIFALRRVLEDFAADEIVKNISKPEIAKLHVLLTELHAHAFDQVDVIQSGANFVRANVAFHSIIMAAARNPYLDRLYAQLQVQVQIVSYLVHRGFNAAAAKMRQEEHEAIVAALEARDARALRRELHTHANTGETLILQSLGTSPAHARPKRKERLATPMRAL